MAWTRRKAVFLAGAALMAAQAQGQAQAQASAQPIKVGVLAPLTGGASDIGNPMLNGMRLAVDAFNATGGYLGRRIELVVKDDQSLPDVGRQQAQAMVEEGVVAVMGLGTTGVAMRTIDVFQTAGVPVIVASATGTAITRGAASMPDSVVFRVSARDDMQIPFAVADLKRRRIQRIAAFVDNSGYGNAGLVDLRQALMGTDIQLVHLSRFDNGVKDLGAEVLKARNAGAQAIFSITLGRENAVLAKARAALGWNVLHIGPWTLSLPLYLEGAREAAEGTLMVQTFIAEPTNEWRTRFLNSYRAVYKVDDIPNVMVAAQGFDAANLIGQAILRIPHGKPLTRAAIKQALETNERAYYGVVTSYKRPFDATDKDAVSPNMLFLGRVQNGRITFAYAEDAQRNALVETKR